MQNQAENFFIFLFLDVDKCYIGWYNIGVKDKEDTHMIKKINGYYYATDKRGNTEKFASYQEAMEWLERRNSR